MSTERKSITLDKDIIKEVERLAEEEERSFSRMIQRMLRSYLEKKYRRDK